MANSYPSGQLNNFPNPFSTYSRTLYPKTVREVFDWAEYLWLHFGTYSQAVKKSVRYFITDVEVFGTKDNHIDYDTRTKYEETLGKTYNIMDRLGTIGDDFISMGNSFTSAFVPIDRQLQCSKCGVIQPLHRVEYTFDSYTFKGTCPACGKSGCTFQRIDQRRPDKDMEVKIIRWSPRNIIIDHCPITNHSRYYLNMPAEWKTAIKKGDPIYMEQLPWEFVEAVREERMFEFNKEYFMHLRQDAPATLIDTMKGWGMPLFMSEFEQVVYIQILDRFNEAIALDHLMPFRVISPPPQVAGGDPMKSINMGVFMGRLRSMIRSHRWDPTAWHTIPFPIQYQALGGEGKEMLPTEMTDAAVTKLLSDIGIPQEFSISSLQGNGNYVPLGLRMFEKVWGHYTEGLNSWLEWFVGVLAKTLTWEPVTARLIAASIYEDDNTRNTKLEMASAGVISKHTAFRTMGIDPDYERERMREEARQDEDAAKKDARQAEESGMLDEQLATPPPMTMETMEGMMQEEGAAPGAPGVQPGQMGQPAAPPMGGGTSMGNTGSISTIDDLMGEAQEIAMQVMQMESSARQSFLRNLAKENEPLHGQVKAALDKLENQAGQQGKIMARQGAM